MSQAWDANGHFVWMELMTEDPDAAVAFYPEVFGWRAAAWGDPDGDMPYTLWMAGEDPIGGCMQLPDEAREGGAPPHWLGYVGVDDVDATVARAGELGGKVLVPGTDIPEVGRFAVLADPAGAVFALLQSAGDPPGHPGGPGLREFSWRDLATTDWRATVGFYESLFRWQIIEENEMGPGTYAIFGIDGVRMGGMYDKPPEMPAPPHWLYYVRVEDIAATLERLRANGGQVLYGPMEVPGGDRVAQVLDAQGVALAVHQTHD